MRNKCFFFSILISSVFLVSSILSAAEERVSFTDVLKEQYISIDGLGGFRLNKKNTFSKQKRVFLSGQDDAGKTLRLEIIKLVSTATAKKYIQDRIYVIESLFKNIPAPYPGELTHSIQVPVELKPEVISLNIVGLDRQAYILYATSRFTYGAGAADLITYRGVLTFIYDEGRESVYILELFVPEKKFIKEDVLKIIKSFKLIP